MINIKRFVVGVVRTNCYLVYKEGSSSAVLIDAGRGYDKIVRYAQNVGVKIEALLLTHGHFDHILEAKKWQESGVKVYVQQEDADKLYSRKNMGYDFGLSVPFLNADVSLGEEEKLNIAGMDILAIHTPGHTNGGCCYIIEDCIFSGDTLFARSYGRLDFEDGSMPKMKQSLAKLFALSGNYKVYPGHEDATTLDEEREANPILREYDV